LNPLVPIVDSAGIALLRKRTKSQIFFLCLFKKKIKGAKHKTKRTSVRSWTERQTYLGEHLSQDDFFKKIRKLEILGDKLENQLRNAGILTIITIITIIHL
jgi:hypothetical protein